MSLLAEKKAKNHRAKEDHLTNVWLFLAPYAKQISKRMKKVLSHVSMVAMNIFAQDALYVVRKAIF